MRKTLIACMSIHHQNTMKVANVIADTLDAQIESPQHINPDELHKYDLIGFGSGIYNRKHHRCLFELVDNLPTQSNKQAFIFSTNTFGILPHHEPLRKKLIEKGFSIVGEFSCPGYMNYSFTKYLFGGISKGRPDADDLTNATEFAHGIEKKLHPNKI